jgi:hypothetical protein
MTEPDWQSLIARERRDATMLRRATAFQHRYGSHQGPIRFGCGNDGAWVVKGHQFPKEAATEMIAYSLGAAIGAPVPPFGIVEVPADLIRRTPALRNIRYPPGQWFGSRFVAGVTNLVDDVKEMCYLHTDVRQNRHRFAMLALFYGWAGTWTDVQFIYDTNSPCLVNSVDHGHFFPKGPEWDASSLDGCTEVAEMLPSMVQAVNLAPAELRSAAQKFRRLDRTAVITAAVARPLDSWGIDVKERVAVARYLHRRGEQLADDLGRKYAT